MLRAIQPLVAVAILLVVLASSGMAEPALWVIHGKNTTIYLLGTVHALKPGTLWETPKIRRAFGQSQDLWLEIGDLASPDAKRQMMQLGFDRAHPLSSKLNLKELIRLDHAAQAAGFPGGLAMDSMRPWFAALALATAPIRKAGFDPKSGVDIALQEQASAAGKPIYGFETMDQQIHFLADLPESQQLDSLREALDDADKGAAKLSPLIDSWAKGDVDTIAQMENDDLKAQSDILYKKLIVDRNQAWAKRVADMSHAGGAHFIAVGAAHLAGPDSLQHALGPYGITASRE